MIPHPIDTEALRRLADAATPGPWHYIPGDHDLASAGIDITAEGDSLTWDDHSGEVFTHPDAEFIAAAREAVPALLDRIARLEAQSDIRGRAVVMYRDRAREAEAERDQAYEWADDQSHPLVMRQGEVLTGVANALNGPPPPRTSWSHHDLAEKAAAMVARAEQAEAERDEWRQTALDERAAALARAPKPAWHDAVAVIAHTARFSERRPFALTHTEDVLDPYNAEWITRDDLLDPIPLIMAKVTVGAVARVSDALHELYGTHDNSDAAAEIITAALGLETAWPPSTSPS